MRQPLAPVPVSGALGRLLRDRSAILNQGCELSLKPLLAILRRRPFRPAHTCYCRLVLDDEVLPSGLVEEPGCSAL